ncbi:hypothetical protein BSKO_09723 [Bryopsis sp. KO-2023]|nr:hypothetical protein BSKO_09723 [Bryopsis sp. KO-2023]
MITILDAESVKFIARALVTIDGKSLDLLNTVDAVSGIPGSGEADEYEGSSLKIEHELICLSVSKEESGASQQTAEAFRQSFRDNCWYLEESLLPGLSKGRGKQLQKVHRILRAAHGAVDTWNQADGLEGISCLQQLIRSIASLNSSNSLTSRLHQSRALEVY